MSGIQILPDFQHSVWPGKKVIWQCKTRKQIQRIIFQGIPISYIFEMVPMPFPCNGILVVLGNFPRIFPMASLIYASFLSILLGLA